MVCFILSTNIESLIIWMYLVVYHLLGITGQSSWWPTHITKNAAVFSGDAVPCLCCSFLQVLLVLKGLFSPLIFQELKIRLTLTKDC